MSGPGRRALIYRAAYHPHISDRERTVLLKIALPAGADLEHALTVAREAREARTANRHEWAQQLLDQLTDTPRMED